MEEFVKYFDSQSKFDILTLTSTYLYTSGIGGKRYVRVIIYIFCIFSSDYDCRNRHKRIKATQPAAPSQAQTPAVTPSQVPTQSVPAQTPAPAVQPQAQPQQVFKPAPAPAPAPLPVYTQQTQSPAHQKKSGLTAVGVSFSVGVLLMVIAAAVFISATWQTMPAVIKCIVLLVVVSGVYGLSTLCRKKLKLEKTSSVLYMLASLITPLAIFVGFLAFGAEDSMFTLVCCAVSLGVSGFVGYKIFGSKLQVAISYLGFVWSEIFLCMQILGNTKGMAFGMCAAAFISGLIYFLRPKLKFFDVFAEVSAYVAVIGLVMTSAFGKYSLPLFIASHILYWVTLLMLTRRESGSHTCPHWFPCLPLLCWE